MKAPSSAAICGLLGATGDFDSGGGATSLRMISWRLPVRLGPGLRCHPCCGCWSCWQSGNARVLGRDEGFSSLLWWCFTQTIRNFEIMKEHHPSVVAGEAHTGRMRGKQ